MELDLQCEKIRNEKVHEEINAVLLTQCISVILKQYSQQKWEVFVLAFSSCFVLTKLECWNCHAAFNLVVHTTQISILGSGVSECSPCTRRRLFSTLSPVHYAPKPFCSLSVFRLSLCCKGRKKIWCLY